MALVLPRNMNGLEVLPLPSAAKISTTKISHAWTYEAENPVTCERSKRAGSPPQIEYACLKGNMKTIISIICFCSVALLGSASAHAVELRVKSDFEAGVEMHERGNIKMAMTFFEQGVAKGDAKSMFALGSYYHFGDGVGKNYAKARELFERSSNAGFADADTMLGIIYREGQGVPADKGRAFGYLEKASLACSDSAQEMLAQMLYEGEGVQRNKVEALAYLYLAARSAANMQATSGVTYVERELDQTQRESARARAREIEKTLRCPSS